VTDGSAQLRNATRAARANHALENWLAAAGVDLPDEHTEHDQYFEWISDLIADLYHLADTHNCEPERLTDYATTHYKAEVEEELQQATDK
jgi:hypothetical protein